MRHHFKSSWLQCLSSPLFSPPYQTNVLMTFQNIVERKTLDNFIHICLHCILCCFTQVSGSERLHLVVSAVYSVNAKFGYGSLLKDDVSRSSKKIGYSQKIRFGHQDLQCKCSLGLLVKAHGEDRSSCNCPLLCLDFSLARTACK